MRKALAYRREGSLWLVMGVAVLVVHAGCFNSGGLSFDASAGQYDLGRADGKVAVLDGNAGKDTRADLGAVDSAGAGRGGGTTAGSGGAAGTGGLATGGTTTGGSTGTGGNTNPDTQPGDAALVDAPLPPPPGGSGGSAGNGGSGGSGGGGGGGGASGGANTQPPPDSSVRDGAVDRPPDTAIDAPACTVSACPGPTSGNGTAVCLNGACSITCNNGYHRCGNTCALNTNPATCGTSCSACPAAASGASPTCSGNPLACGFTCNPGYHSCGSTCVANGSTDRNSCGNSCTVCQAPPASGSVSCNGTACIPSCNPGFHLCGTLCIANSSVSGCGSRCTACPTPAHGSATCTGSSPVCGITCNTNYHQCDNTCVASTDPNNCGPACSICAGDAHGQATCSGNPGTCGITCNRGYHLCAGKCVSNTDLATCGTTSNDCTPCPADPGYVATCTGATPKCGQRLRDCLGSGMHRCGIACVAEGVDSCGTSCNICPDGGDAVLNSSRVCSGGACDFICDAGFHDCSALTDQYPECVDDTSPQTCGSNCDPCPPPPSSGIASCISVAGTTKLTCGVSCDPRYHACGTSDGLACVSNTSKDPNSCGMSCKACPTPSASHTVATCDGSVCGFGCENSTYHLCLDPSSPNSPSCSLNEDASHCLLVAGETTCGVCGSTQVCTGGTCVAVSTATDTATATATDTSTVSATDTSTVSATDTSTVSASH